MGDLVSFPARASRTPCAPSRTSPRAYAAPCCEVRKVNPAALMMIADTCEYYHSVDGAFPEEAEFRSQRRFLVHDLYQGLVNRDHPMWACMVATASAEWELDWFLEQPGRLDILGL